jgi:hypothetical protein
MSKGCEFWLSKVDEWVLPEVEEISWVEEGVRDRKIWEEIVMVKRALDEINLDLNYKLSYRAFCVDEGLQCFLSVEGRRKCVPVWEEYIWQWVQSVSSPIRHSGSPREIVTVVTAQFFIAA